MKRSFIVIIMAILAIAAILILKSTAKDEFKGWKTYTNDRYGYQLKFPPDWEGNFDSLAGTPPEQNNEEFAPRGAQYAAFVITVYTGNPDEILQKPADYEWNLRAYIEKLKNSGEVKNVREFKIDGEIAYSVTTPIEAPAPILAIYFEHKNKLFEIRTEENEISLKIISTLKFLP